MNAANCFCLLVEAGQAENSGAISFHLKTAEGQGDERSPLQS